MSSLSVHLRLPEDHSGLPFHPSCPVCRRDRLAGSLGGDELVSRRAQAAVTAGLLAFGGLGAPVAVASGPDAVIEGGAEAVEGGDAGAPDFEETTGLDDAEALVPDDADLPAAPAPDEVTREAEAVEDPAEPVVEATEEVAAEPTPAPAPIAIVAPPVDDATEAPEPTASEGPVVDREQRAERERRVVRRFKQRVVVAPVHVVAPAPASAPVPVASAPVAPVSVRVVAGASAAPGDRFHVVQRGESLWSIAADVLGERASVARVAQEVSRLWALNEDRIASGDPDLLYVGTRLRLR